MLPTVWIFDMYSVMLFIGVAVCLLIFDRYCKYKKIDNKFTYCVEMTACIVIMIGLITATLFQSLFDALKENSSNSSGAMTFFGGLVGGVVSFLLIYQFYIKKKYPNNKFMDVLIIAPSCITAAHGFGRIGCFLAGCCYGKETDSFLGVTFPGMSHAVYPTQLFEAIFLLILSAVLAYLAFKYSYSYTMVIYLYSYGVFRFLIEFIRGDDRGAYLLAMSPSQWFSIACIIISTILLIYLKNKNNIKK